MEDGELRPTIRINAHHHMAQPSSRTELLSSTSQTYLLMHLVLKVARLLVQRIPPMYNRDRTASHQQNQNNFAQHSHLQVPHTLIYSG